MVLKRIPDHNIWMEAVFDVVKFLSSNGLPFRGHDESTDFISGDVSGGIYLNTFSDLLFQINPELEKISKKLPTNAKHRPLKLTVNSHTRVIELGSYLSQRLFHQLNKSWESLVHLS